MGSACSTTLNVDLLSSGCQAPEVECEGRCVSAAVAATVCDNGPIDTPTGGSGGTPQASDEPCLVRHPFAFVPNGQVESIHLSGTMNDWSETSTPLEPGEDGVYKVELDLPPGEYVYKFLIDGSRWITDPANSQTVNGEDGTVNSIASVYPYGNPKVSSGCPTQCYAEDAPNWSDEVMYSLMIDRFVDSDGMGSAPAPDGSAENPRFGWGGGDIQGVIDELPYIHDLGTSLIWLSPPQKQGPGGYHGYWPARPEIDFDDAHVPSPSEQVEPRFGTPEQLVTLLDRVHATPSLRGGTMKILLDYVPNHVHEASPLAAAHPDWFYLQNGKPILCDNGTANGLWGDPLWGKLCTFSGFLWPFDYEANPDAVEWSIADMKSWLELGFDGFRVDAARHLPDSFIEALREEVDGTTVSEGREPLLLGETFSYDPDDMRNLVDPVTRLDGQLDFPTRKHLCQALLTEEHTLGHLAYQLALESTAYPNRSVMATFLGSHDIPRQIHHASGEIRDCLASSNSSNTEPFQFSQPTKSEPYERLALAFVALLTNPGIPTIYAGEEIGLAGGGDPENRRMMPWDQDELLEPQKQLRATVRAVARLRGQHVALRRGPRRTFSADDETWVFERVGCGSAPGVVVAINRSDEKVSLRLPDGKFSGVLIGPQEAWNGQHSVDVPARSFVILERAGK